MQVLPLNIPHLVGIGLTEFPNSGWAKAHPAHPLAASLNRECNTERGILILKKPTV